MDIYHINWCFFHEQFHPSRSRDTQNRVTSSAPVAVPAAPIESHSPPEPDDGSWLHTCKAVYIYLYMYICNTYVYNLYIYIHTENYILDNTWHIAWLRQNSCSAWGADWHLCANLQAYVECAVTFHHWSVYSTSAVAFLGKRHLCQTLSSTLACTTCNISYPGKLENKVSPMENCTCIADAGPPVEGTASPGCSTFSS